MSMFYSYNDFMREWLSLTPEEMEMIPENEREWLQHHKDKMKVISTWFLENRNAVQSGKDICPVIDQSLLPENRELWGLPAYFRIMIACILEEIQEAKQQMNLQSNDPKYEELALTILRKYGWW